MSGVKVEDVAREIVQRAGRNWDELDELDRTVYRNIARAMLFLSDDVTVIEE